MAMTVTIGRTAGRVSLRRGGQATGRRSTPASPGPVPLPAPGWIARRRRLLLALALAAALGLGLDLGVAGAGAGGWPATVLALAFLVAAVLALAGWVPSRRLR